MKSIEFPREIDFWRDMPEFSSSETLLQLNVSIVTLSRIERIRLQRPTILQIRDELVEE